jgi:hypothetical protein
MAMFFSSCCPQPFKLARANFLYPANFPYGRFGPTACRTAPTDAHHKKARAANL